MTFRDESLRNGDHWPAEQPGRVVAGVETTLSGLQALRVAVAEARRRRAVLHAVRVWGAGPAEIAAQSPGAASLAGPLGMGTASADATDQPPDSNALAASAEATVARAFAEIMGGEPPDVTVQVVVLPEIPGSVLTEYACRPDDLLVIGSGRRGRLRRPRGSPVVRYCLRHASCPVLVVPPPPLTRAGSPRALMRQLRREIDHLADGGAER